MSRRWEDMNERERWLIQVEEKMKRGNQILFDRNSVLLQPLIDLLCVQNRRAVVLWCLDGMEEILERIRLIDPTETRAEEAVGTIRQKYGYAKIQRGIMFEDRLALSMDVRGERLVRPAGVDGAVASQDEGEYEHIPLGEEPTEEE